MITFYAHECADCGREQRSCYRSEDDATTVAEAAGWHVDGDTAWCRSCAGDRSEVRAREDAAERDADDRRHGV